MCRVLFCLLLLLWFVSLQASEEPPKAKETGSAFTAKEVEEFVAYHNKVRQEVKVEPVKWSPTLAKYAQQWADHLAASGDFKHRPSEGEWMQKYGENLAIDATLLRGAEAWGAEIKDYTANTPIPEDLTNFKAGHYTQMVWKKTTHLGAGHAIVQQGPFKGSLLIVCNYDPPGNFLGEKPY
jgi:pathogenesis-related protein 1